MYAVYYRVDEKDTAWKRCCETYKNRKGFTALRDLKFETLAEAEEKASHFKISKIKELKK